MAISEGIPPPMPFRFSNLPAEMRDLILEESVDHVRLRQQPNAPWLHSIQINTLDPVLRFVDHQTKYEVDRITRKANHVYDTLEIHAGIMSLAQRVDGHFNLPPWLRNSIKQVNVHISTQVVPDNLADDRVQDVRLYSEIMIHRQWIADLARQMTHTTRLHVSLELFSRPDNTGAGPNYGALLQRGLADMMRIKGLEVVEMRKTVHSVSGNTSIPSLAWNVQKGWYAPAVEQAADKQAADK